MWWVSDALQCSNILILQKCMDICQSTIKLEAVKDVVISLKNVQAFAQCRVFPFSYYSLSHVYSTLLHNKPGWEESDDDHKCLGEAGMFFFIKKTAHNWALMRFLIGTGLLLLHSPPLSYLLVVSGDERTCFPAGVERLQAALEPRGVWECHLHQDPLRDNLETRYCPL